MKNNKATLATENVASSSRLQVTPHIATVGLGLTLESGFMDVANKVASLPSTPGGRPLSHLITEPFVNEFEQVALDSAVNRLKNLPVEGVDEFVTSPAQVVSNRFSVLEEEQI